MALQLFARIEESFGRMLPLAVLFQHGALDRLAKLLMDLSIEDDVATILSLQPEGDERPLFMMPNVGGGVMLPRALLESIGRRFPIYGVQLSLASQNLERFKDFHATGGCLVSALRKFQPHGPYALAGFSYGGMMAFEVARLLTELGEEVDLLAVIDTGPNCRFCKPSLMDRWRRPFRIAANLPSWVREESRDFSVHEFSARVVLKLRRFYRLLASQGRAKLEIDDIFDLSRLPSQNLELKKALFNGFRDYIPGAYLGKLTLICAKTQQLLKGHSQDLGWSPYVSALDIRPIPGNHETILRPPHVAEVARQLTDLMKNLS